MNNKNTIMLKEIIMLLIADFKKFVLFIVCDVVFFAITAIVIYQNNILNNSKFTDVGTMFFVRHVLSYIFLGIVIGVLVAFVWECIKQSISAKIIYNLQLNDLFGVFFIGNIHIVKNKTELLLNKIDNMNNSQEANNSVEYISKIISCTKKINEKVLFVSTVSFLDGEIDLLLNCLKKKDMECKFICNCLQNIETIDNIGLYDKIIIIESLNKSKCKEVNRLLEEINLLGKKIIGYIIA